MREGNPTKCRTLGKAQELGTLAPLQGLAHWVSLKRVGSKSEKQLLFPLNRNTTGAVPHQKTVDLFSRDSRLKREALDLGMSVPGIVEGGRKIAC